MPLQYFGEKNLSKQHIVRIESINSYTNECRGSWHGVVYEFVLPTEYRIDPFKIQLLQMHLSENNLYAAVDIGSAMQNCTDHQCSLPPDCRVVRCNLLGFAKAQPNYNTLTGVRRLYCYQNHKGAAICGTPVVYVQQPPMYTENGVNEVSYQLKFESTAVISADADGVFCPVIENSVDPEPFTKLHGVDRLRAMLDRYINISDFINWWLHRDHDADYPEIRDVHNLTQFAHAIWRFSNTENDDISHHSGTSKDPRQLCDTVESITCRQLAVLYNLPDWLTENMTSIRTETYVDIDELVEDLKNIRKHHRNREVTVYVKTLKNKKHEWMAYNTSARFDELVEKSEWWHTPYIAIESVNKNTSRSNVTLVFTPDITRIRSTKHARVQAYSQGRSSLQALSQCTELNSANAAVNNAMDNVIRPNTVRYKIIHTGAKFRGENHLISHLPWCNRWLYHGYVKNNMPGSYEMYRYGIECVHRNLTYLYPQMRLQAVTIPDGEWTPSIPTHMYMPMCDRIPMFEIPLKPQNTRLQRHL
jgi:hypothetical protein